MPKPSALLVKTEQKYAAYYQTIFIRKCDTLAQMCKDAACIAANDVLKMGAGRSKAFCEAFDRIYNDMLQMARGTHQLFEKEDEG